MSRFTADPQDTRKDACFRIWVKSASSSIPYISKYMDPGISIANQSENDWIVIRYADVVLLYAEVLAQGANPDDARAEVNKIRTRAGMNPYISFDSKEEALDSVYQERRLELAFENQRWFDLLRMGKSYNNPEKAVEVLSNHIFVVDWTLLYSLYNPILPPESRFFKKERLLLPIPQSEIDTNNEMKITQNDDY
jgi:hypothetical protein